MSTEQWLIEQEENARRAKEAYQMLFEVYLNMSWYPDTEGNSLCVIAKEIEDKIENFFRSE